MENLLKRFIPSKKKNMNLNRTLGENKVIKIFIVVLDIALYLTITYLANFIVDFTKIISSIGNNDAYFKWYRCLVYMGDGKMTYYFFFFVSLIILDVCLVYKFKISYSETYFNIGQKGTARWTTKEEIKSQYKAVPEKDVEYPGDPGTIVAHFDGKIYIDTKVTNNLGIGITRSGKGEMYIFKTIDIYSRATNKASLVVNDPKFECYKSSKSTLENRGYEVHLLNLDEPLFSMGYNPLTLVIDYYKKGEKATAYSVARTFAYSIFHTGNDNGEPIWKNTATDLFTALIIAVTEDLLALDDALNEQRLQAYNIKQENYRTLSDEKKAEVEKQIEELQKKEKDVISDRSIMAISENVSFNYLNLHEKQITVFNIIILFSELARQEEAEDESKSKLDSYFNKRPLTDLAKLKYATIEFGKGRTKGSIYTNMLSQLGVFIDENIAKMTAESSIKLENVGFGEKPMAIFIGTPDYDMSNHFLVSVFIRQLYFVLAKRCTKEKSQACTRHVRFLIDEFGSMPEIEAMSSIITVDNGRNIGFDLWVQSYAQINSKYGDDAQTIIDNCANEIYIKSGDEETLEKFSTLLGTETYIDVQRSGSKMSLKRTFTELASERPLMRKEELAELKEGECIVIRKLKRKDNAGNDIDLKPIFNSKENQTAFLYRYMYLTKTFPNPTEIQLEKANTESREYIDLDDRAIDLDEIYNGIDKQIGLNPEITYYTKYEHYDLINKKLTETIGDNYWDILGIQKNMSIAMVMSIIENTSLLKQPTKIAIRSLVNHI